MGLRGDGLMTASLVSSPTLVTFSNTDSETVSRTPGTAGNLLIAIHGSSDNDEPISTITGTHDNGWTKASNGADPYGDIIEIYYAYTDGTGDADSITVALDGDDYAGVLIFEATGMATSSPLQVGTYAIANTATTVAPTLTPTNSGPLISAAAQEGGYLSISSGWTVEEGDRSGAYFNCATQTGTGETPYTATWTAGSSSEQLAVILAVLPPGVVTTEQGLFMGTL